VPVVKGAHWRSWDNAQRCLWYACTSDNHQDHFFGEYLMTSDLASLAARVERLEKQYSLLKSELVTQKLVIADQDGKTRASVTVLKGDVPTLVLNDVDGKASVVLRVSKEGPALHLIASQTNAGLEVTVGDGGSDISLFDASGKLRAALNVVPPAHPALQELGMPVLAMYNPNGTSSVALSVVGGRGGLNLTWIPLSAFNWMTKAQSSSVQRMGKFFGRRPRQRRRLAEIRGLVLIRIASFVMRFLNRPFGDGGFSLFSMIHVHARGAAPLHLLKNVLQALSLVGHVPPPLSDSMHHEIVLTIKECVRETRTGNSRPN
jgi:hypothetical protein